MKSPLCSATLLYVALFWPGVLFSQAVVEGQVELPKTHSAPVMNKRYEVVTKGGVLSTNPPQAVVYLEGAFSKPATLPTEQMSQQDLAFNPGLLPVQVGTKIGFPNFDDTCHDVIPSRPPSVSTWGATGRTSSPCRRKSSTWRGWSPCVATSIESCSRRSGSWYRR